MLGLVLLTGCLHPVREVIDGAICDLATQPRDLQPLAHADLTSPAPGDRSEQATGPDREEVAPAPEKAPEAPAAAVRPMRFQERTNGDRSEPEARRPRFDVPSDLLPAGPVEPLRLPSGEDADARRQAVGKLYPPLPALTDEMPYPPGPAGRPLTLADLQKLALTNHPQIRQAAARIEEARGTAIQAGLPPNPIVGYEGDTTGTTGGAGYQGGFVQQTIRTANKLQLARAVAAMDVKNAELELFNTQIDVATHVRTNYFAFLVAGESVRLNRALVTFTTDLYQLQVEGVQRGGFAAPYEPMYLRALATQARAALVQARNRRTAAWKQLAASLGLPGMPPTCVAGRLDVPLPAFEYKAVLARMLAGHADLRVAHNSLVRAQFHLELQRKTPIPDVDVRVMVQKDHTAPPFQASPSVAVSVPVPVWDRNQGNILEAQAAVVRAGEEAHRVRSELTGTLAEAFERYESNRVLLGYYRDRILPDLVRVFRGVYDRYQREPAAAGGEPPGFTDVVVAQQNLAQAIATYITTLGQMWQSVVEIADHLQTLDLFGIDGPKHDVPLIPDLGALPPLPCCHPCSPLHEAHHQVVDGLWPASDALVPGVVPAPAKAKPLPPPRENPAPQNGGDGKNDLKKNSPPPRSPAPTGDPLLLSPPPVPRPAG